MLKQTKRGFTITELVIVIVVIAILAAVLIPTFASLIKKANQSADVQAARQMNLALKAGSAEKKPDFKGAMDILDDAGFEVASLSPVTKGHTFYWCSEHNAILLVEDAEDKVLHPTDKDVTEKYADHKAANYLIDLEEGATYINVEAADSESANKALANGSDLSLKADVVLDNKVYKVPAGKEMTVDLNGHTLDASAAQYRPFEMEDGSTLTINAEGATVKCAQYGLVHIPAEVDNCTVVINGGTFTADLDDASFIKFRASDGNVNIVLNNVNYTDVSNNGWIISDSGFSGSVNLTVKGGSYTSHYGFQTTTPNPNSKVSFEDVTIKTAACSIIAEGCKDVSIKNCNLTSGSEMQNADQNTPAAAVMVACGGKATVDKCTINAATHTYAVLNTGGTITVTNSTTSGAGVAKLWKLNTGVTGAITIDGVAVPEATA